MASPATIKQRIHILNTIIKPKITYAYYVVPLSKPDIKKLDKVLNKLTKEICNLPNSTTNALTHLSHEDFGMNTTSILPNYIHCIGKQLLNALNDQGQLGQIYQGLTNYIIAKYGGSYHLPRLKYHACVRSLTARTLYLLEREYEIHVQMTTKKFPIKQSAIEHTWLQTEGYALLSQDQKQTTKKYLNKLHMYNITALTQIQNLDTHQILSPKEFKQKFKAAPKLIKEALAQA